MWQATFVRCADKELLVTCTHHMTHCSAGKKADVIATKSLMEDAMARPTRQEHADCWGTKRNMSLPDNMSSMHESESKLKAFFNEGCFFTLF